MVYKMLKVLNEVVEKANLILERVQGVCRQKNKD